MKASLPKLILSAVLCWSTFFNAQAQCSITTSTNASALSCGVSPLTSCGGILYIGDGTTAMTVTMDTALNLTCLGALQIIVRNNATLFFTPGNDYLTLAEGSSLTFLAGAGLTGGSCNASERIYIGTNLLASCNGGAGADMSFADLLFFGGTGSAASNSPVCTGGTINLTATPPPNGTYVYSWSGPGLAGTPYISSPNYSLTATNSGTYQVKMKGTIGATTKIAIAEITVTVSPLSTPLVGTVTQPNCSVATGSVGLSSLPAAGWTITRSGTSSATYNGTGTSTTISGLPLGTYTFSVNNGLGCTSGSTGNITITPTSASIWNGTSWSNGTPTITTNVVFNGNYSLNADVHGCSCQVQSGTVVIKSGHVLNINRAVTVLSGSLTISDNASLVQTDDSAVNSGNIIVKRATMVRKFDYVYWSSPVSGFPLTSVSPNTSTAHLWKWIPTQGGNYGTWTSANENMVTGKGYIVRGPMDFDNITAQKFTATFTGLPHNGVITPTIERGSYQGANYPAPNGSLVTNRDDNYNLIGNPYPSSIKALDFLTLNTNLEGAVRIWTHGTLPSSSAPNPFYGSFLYNYTDNDYIVYNGTGTISGPSGFNGYIASGQAFFVAMIDGDATVTTATFNNSMRRYDYNNSQFYRMNQSASEEARESGRIWLDLVSGAGTVRRTLIGYILGATLAKDRMYDANIKLGSQQNLYSMIREQKMCIQGRPLPFDPNDEVAIGFQSAAADSYTFAIGAVDGFFEDDKPILLKDQLTNTIHDLRLSPYPFSTLAGTFNDRFTLLFNDGGGIARQSAVSHDELADRVIVAQRDGSLNLTALGSMMKDVKGYDLLGHEILNREVNGNSLQIEGLHLSHQVLILHIRLNDGNTIVKKISY